MSLIPLVTQLAMESGCPDRGRCEEVLGVAEQGSVSLVEALLEAELVEENQLARNLAKGIGLEFLENSEVDLSQPLHSRFPAKLALRYRLLPGRMEGGGRFA